MTRFELDAESRDKRRVRALERIADAAENPGRVPVAATTVRDDTGARDIAVVVCADGTAWGIGPAGDCVKWGTIPGSVAATPDK